MIDDRDFVGYGRGEPWVIDGDVVSKGPLDDVEMPLFRGVQAHCAIGG